MTQKMNALTPPKPHDIMNDYARFALNLILRAGGLRELKGDSTASEASVDLGVGVESVVDSATLLLIENDLEDLAVVLLCAETLANDLDGVDEVSQDGVVDSSKGAAARALLLLGVARAVGTLRLRKDAA